MQPAVGHDVGGVQEVVVGQVADGAAMVVGGEDYLPEGGLVQAWLDQTQGVAPLGHVERRCRRSKLPHQLSRCTSPSPSAMRALQSVIGCCSGSSLQTNSRLRTRWVSSWSTGNFSQPCPQESSPGAQAT
jgi:hypothetical protein